MQTLLNALCAEEGIICVVGAGGKKTTLYRLAEAHRGKLAITSTVLVPPFRSRLRAFPVIAEIPDLPARVAEAAREQDRIAYAGPIRKPARHAGVPAGMITSLHQDCGFQLTLVKGDGARLRLAKAPNATEPVFPSRTDTVIPLVSVRILGQPANGDRIRRIEEFCEVTGAAPEEPVTPEHLARLIASERGFLQGTGDRRVVPVINMVETTRERELARSAAEQALERCDRLERVVLAAMEQDQPIVDIIRR
jgi:probable selenium-dependent hydroxylase accessory protein YqeC